ncbi:MAG: glycosyltransferase family 2 protein [Silicimonas sp.]|nr:glycosyltransferase family 2 protein [Silicimonas sp.]
MALDVAIYFDGGKMHFLHHLTLMSAVNRGHAVTLYVRGSAQNIPDTVRVEDAGKIVDPRRLESLDGARLRSTVFQYEALAVLKDTVTLSFDHFLYGKSDLVARDGLLFGWQSDSLIGTGVLALPPDSPALATIRGEIDRAPPRDAHLGKWGSQLLTHALKQSGEIRAALPRPAFYLLDPHQAGITLDRNRELAQALSNQVLALPVYHEHLLPIMRDGFHGLPRYWSTLGSAIRQNGVAVRAAPAFETASPPDRVWNNERQQFSCRDWPELAAARSDARSLDNVARAKPAPSSSLVIDADPAPALSSAKTDELKVMIVTTMRNEAPFILEWVAYHRSIGVTDFVVYTNDCDDGTVELLDALAERGLITARIDNPFRASSAGDWQRAALWDLQDSDLVRNIDWLIPMDVDEYINIHTGEGHFADLVRALPDADMISMVWRLFGNSLIDSFEDRFVTEQFDHAARADCARPSMAWGFKTAFRPEKVGGVWSVHRPKNIEHEKDRLNWYLGTGNRLEERFFKGGWRVDRKSAGYDLVTLNHYALRSSESYLVKKHRGRVNHTKEDQDIGYFFRMNHNVERERSIGPKVKQARSLFDTFMQDDALRTLHQAGVANHRAQIQRLREDSDYSRLYGTITSTLMQVYSRLTPHFGNWIFAVGPKAIPAEYENWALGLHEGRRDSKADTDPPGLQPSGTILPRPEFLEKINENRKTNLPNAKELGPEIFDNAHTDASS